MSSRRILSDPDARLPEAIEQLIRRLVHRIRALLLLRGALVAGAVGLVALLSVMALDALVSLPRLLRGALTLAGLGVFGAAAYRFLLRPLSRAFTAAGVARMVEVHHPEFHERLSSAVELLASRDDAALRGSEELIAELVRAAQADVKHVRPEHEFNWRALARYAGAAGAALALAAALFAAWPRQMQRLLVRSVVPFSDVGNLEALGLSVEPGDADWPAGDPLTVSAVIDRRADGMELRVPGLQGKEAVLPMNPAPAEAERARFTYTFPKVSAPLQYRVVCRGAISRLYTVTPRARPAVTRMDLHYELPDYTGSGPVDIPDSAGDIAALAGTRVTVQAAFSKRVRAARFLVNGAGVPGSQTNLLASSWYATFPVPAGTGGAWRVELEDDWGIRNATADFPLRVEPDAAPTVRIVQPIEPRLAIPPDDRVLIRYVARDDYGFADVTLALQPSGGSPVERAVSAPAPDGEGRWVGEALLDLARPELRAAREITVRVRVRDNLPAKAGGPNAATSEPLILTVEANAADFLQQRLDRMTQRVHEGIDRIVTLLRAAQDTLQGLDEQARAAGPLPEALRARLTQFGKGAQEGRTAIEGLAALLEETDFSPLATALTRIAEDPVDAAIGHARLVELQSDAAKRSESARSAHGETGRSITELLALKTAASELAGRLRLSLQLREIAEKEAELAAEADALDRDAAAEAEWRRQQESTLQELEALDAGAAEPPASGEVPRLAGDLAEDAKRLAIEQEQLARLAKEALKSGAADPASLARLREAALAILESRQRSLVRKTRALAAGMQKDGRGDAAAALEAGNAGKLAAEELAAKRPAAAVTNADASASALTRAAGEKKNEREGQAAALAAEQADIAALLRAAQQPSLAAAVQALQESVRRRAEALAERARKLRDEAMEAQQRKAKDATDNLQAAADKSKQAESELEKKPLGGERRPNPNSMGGAGDKGGMAPIPLPGNRSGPKMNQEPTHTRAMETEGTPEPSDMSGPAQQAMEDAADALRQADQALKDLSGMNEMEAAQQDAENAADAASAAAAQSAAQDASAAALAASSKLGSGPRGAPNRSVPPASWRGGERLRALGISEADWARLPGMLQEHLLADRGEKMPEEYRALVRRYLREVARLGSGKAEPNAK